MYWADLVVVGVILGSALIGLMNGFINTLYKLASYFLSIYLAVKFSPMVSKILKGTELFTSIKEAFAKNLPVKDITNQNIAGQDVKLQISEIFQKMNLPEFFQNNLMNQIPDTSNIINIGGIIDSISTMMAGAVIDIISLIIVFIVIKIALSFFGFILNGVSKLPVFKQLDKIGGFGFGFVIGLLVIYISCAVLVIFNSSPQFQNIFTAIENSYIAKFFYENNFIVDILSSNK